MPYYEHTREEEILDNMLEGFNEDSIIRIQSLKELDKYIR